MVSYDFIDPFLSWKWKWEGRKDVVDGGDGQVVMVCLGKRARTIGSVRTRRSKNEIEARKHGIAHGMNEIASHCPGVEIKM